MKVLIVVSCLLAAASASLLGVTSSQYHAQDELGQYSYGYANENSQKQEIRTADGITQGGYSYVDAYGLIQSAQYVSDPVNGFRVAATNLPQAPVDPANIASVAHAVAPVAIAPVGVAETPEVVAAKIAHAHAHAVARSNLAHAGNLALYRKKRSVVGVSPANSFSYSTTVAHPLAYAHSGLYAHAQHLPVIVNGVPLDTPEVQHAKIAHAQAHAEARASHGYSAYVTNPWAYAQHYPVIANGVPVETLEVQQAKAAHFAAHAQARASHGLSAYVASPWAYAQHYPVIANGVPVETPEVQQAKAAHFAAHAAARANLGLVSPWAYAAHAPIIVGGVPQDTPEVQHAKAAHFAAHAEANARNAHAW